MAVGRVRHGLAARLQYEQGVVEGASAGMVSEVGVGERELGGSDERATVRGTGVGEEHLGQRPPVHQAARDGPLARQLLGRQLFGRRGGRAGLRAAVREVGGGGGDGLHGFSGR